MAETKPKRINYKEVLKFTCHKNVENWNGDIPIQGGHPNFGQYSVVLHSSLPAGEYTGSVWQYEDSGNLSVTLSSFDYADEQKQAPATAPAASLPQARRSLTDD